MPILRIRGGFTLSIGEAGTFVGGSVISVDDEFAAALAHMTEPVSKKDAAAASPTKVKTPELVHFLAAKPPR